MKIDTPILQYVYSSATADEGIKKKASSYVLPRVSKPHLEPFSHFLLVRSGKTTVTYEGINTVYHAPYLLYVKKHHTAQWYHHNDIPYEKYMLRARHIASVELQKLYSELNQCVTDCAVIPLSEKRINWLYQICDHMIEQLTEFKLPPTDERVLLSHRYLLEELLYTVKNRSALQEESLPPHIESVLRFITDHLSEKLTIDEIANHVYIGKTKLCTDFKELFGISIHQYVLKSRIELSKEYLVKGYAVREVAAMCGFTDSAHFNRIFKKYCHILPSKYQISSKPS